MKIIIIGAGELGRLLAKALCFQRHNVVVIDSDHKELDRLGDHLDVLRIEGSCTNVNTLKKAGVEQADAILSVSGDEAANILSCQLAARFGVQQTICRLFRSGSISEADGISPETFGIRHVFSAPEACVRKFMGVLAHPMILEMIQFGHPDACMAIMQISGTSPLLGVRLRDITAGNLLDHIRIAAVLHGNQFLIPHGDTILGKGDKIYIAGRKNDVQNFISWVSPEQNRHGRVIIAGAGDTGLLLAKTAFEQGYDVRLIEPDKRAAENALNEVPSGVMLLNGDPTEEDLLTESGIGTADAFASTAEDDENNILSCIIAKRLGVKKVAALTHKPEYIRIVPAMDLIDCGFSATLIAANTVLRLLGGGTLRLDANLLNYGARFAEYRLTKHSPLAGKTLLACALPPSIVFALVFRKNDVITPSGQTVLQIGDIVVSVVTKETAKILSSLFPEES